MSRETEFDNGFEKKLHRAMQTHLGNGFQGTRRNPENIDIDQVRREIRENYSLLEHSDQATKEKIITATLYHYISNAAMTWIKRERTSQYTEIVDTAVMLAQNLVIRPELRNDESVDSLIENLKLTFIKLYNDYSGTLLDRSTALANLNGNTGNQRRTTLPR